MKNPPHSGDFIRTEIVEPAGLSVTAAALGVSRQALALGFALSRFPGHQWQLSNHSNQRSSILLLTKQGEVLMK
jgi:hypothetical protein